MSRPAQLAAAFAAGMVFANMLPRLGVVEIAVVVSAALAAYTLGRRRATRLA